MLKRLWKNAILALCILALVLQPVGVFADSYSLSYSDYINFLTQELDDDANVTLIDDAANLPSAITSLPEYHEDSIISYFYNSGYPFVFISDIPTGNIGFQVTSGFTSISLNSNFGGQGGTSYILNLDGTFNTVSYYIIGAFPPHGTNTPIFVYIGDDFKFIYGSYTYTVTNNTSPTYPSVNPSNPESITGANYPLNIYTQLGLMFALNFNSYTPDGSVHFNPSWVGVGQALTYDYLCKSNPSQSSVNVTLADGSVVSLNNWVYYIDHHLTYLRSGQELMYNKLNTISQNTTDISDISNRLEMAFPEDQAEMNDAIADQILDDTNDTGLTVNRITSAKSDLDDGLSTFKLDTSGSQYSNPFSALSDADWSFWSQTTLNNLGSGYSYSFGAGSLMSEDDVFTENQNTLLDLLGW